MAPEITHSYSRTALYKKCPLAFWYNYHRGWEKAQQGVDRPFGSAFHEAHRMIWWMACRPKPRSQEKIAQLAFQKFMQVWEGLGMPMGEDLLTAEWLKKKTPENARETIQEYVKRRWDYMRASKLIGQELPFRLLLGKLADGTDIYIHGKLDTVISQGSSIYVLEVKTTSTGDHAKGELNWNWRQGWWPNDQINIYAWEASQRYGDRFAGIELDAIVISDVPGPRKIIKLFRPAIATQKTLDKAALEQYTWSSQIKAAEDRWEAGQPLWACFPSNRESCVGRYGPCDYINICRETHEPETLVEPPEGFRIKERK